MRRLPGALVLGATCLMLAACAGSTGAAPARGAAPVVVDVPVRASTAGDALLGWAPRGAQGVLEVDLARLRANPAVGPAVERLLAGPPAADMDMQLLRRADAMLLCSYALGRDEAVTLTLVRGPDIAALGRGTALDADTVAVGPPTLVARAQAVRQGRDEPLTADRALLAERARAMPAGAGGAALRVAARLDFEARIALAGRFDLDQVPTTVSIWGDVADDLAVVAILGGADRDEAADLVQVMAGWRDRLARSLWARASGLGAAVGGIDIDIHGSATRAIFLIGPRRLTQLVERLSAGEHEP